MLTDMSDRVCRAAVLGHMGKINLFFIFWVKVNGALIAISFKGVRGHPVTGATVNASIIDEKRGFTIAGEFFSYSCHYERLTYERLLSI